MARLRSLSPLAVLERGYALVMDADGAVIRSASQVAQGDHVRTRSERRRVSAAQLMKSARNTKSARSEAMSKAGTRKLFGTDGIRGVAGEPPLDAKTIYATGLALGHSLRGKTEPRVLLGRDTRESSPWIAATMAAALRDTGVQVESAGVVPTPAVAFLARTHGFDAGVVISASHNPWRDNGSSFSGRMDLSCRMPRNWRLRTRLSGMRR